MESIDFDIVELLCIAFTQLNLILRSDKHADKCESCKDSVR